VIVKLPCEATPQLESPESNHSPMIVEQSAHVLGSIVGFPVVRIPHIWYSLLAFWAFEDATGQFPLMYIRFARKSWQQSRLPCQCRKLDDQFFAALDKCTGSSCTVNWASLSGHSSLRDACSALKGALATYKLSISCDDSLEEFFLSATKLTLTSLPFCLVSTWTNKSCGPKLIEDVIEFAFNSTGCTETATYTGYSDYSTPKPLKKPVKKPIKKPIRKPVKVRRALAMD
jgi:hypothetical protein